MILRFLAKGDALCPVPGQGIMHGAPLNYVGRKLVKATQKDERGEMVACSGYPATQEPFECDSESATAATLKRDLLVSSSMGDPCLYPADKETAAFCGVSFTDVSFKDGAWTEKAKASK